MTTTEASILPSQIVSGSFVTLCFLRIPFKAFAVSFIYIHDHSFWLGQHMTCTYACAIFCVSLCTHRVHTSLVLHNKSASGNPFYVCEIYRFFFFPGSQWKVRFFESQYKKKFKRKGLIPSGLNDNQLITDALSDYSDCSQWMQDKAENRDLMLVFVLFLLSIFLLYYPIPEIELSKLRAFVQDNYVP